MKLFSGKKTFRIILFLLIFIIVALILFYYFYARSNAGSLTSDEEFMKEIEAWSRVRRVQPPSPTAAIDIDSSVKETGAPSLQLQGIYQWFVDSIQRLLP